MNGYKKQKQYKKTKKTFTYKQTIKQTIMNENYLKIGIYYYIDDETGKKVYDEEEMLREFENKLYELLKQK